MTKTKDMPIRDPSAPQGPPQFTEEELRVWRTPPMYLDDAVPPSTSSAYQAKSNDSNDLAIANGAPPVPYKGHRGYQQQDRTRGSTEKHGIRVGEIATLPPEPEKMGDLEIARGALTVLAAREKTGKTTLASGEAVKISQQGYAVLWISYDEPPKLVHRRFQKHGRAADNIIVLKSEEMPRFRFGTDAVKKLQEIVESIYPDYIVLDTLSSYAGAVLKEIPDHADGESWQKIMSGLQRMAIVVDAGMLVLAHSAKGEKGIRGSTGIGAGADDIIVFEGQKSKRTPKPFLEPYRGVTVAGRHGVREFIMEYDKATDTYHRVDGSRSDTPEVTAEEEIEYWILSNPEMSNNDVYKKVGGARGPTLQLIKDIREELDKT